VRIALDAMGTDRHPHMEVLGAVRALREVSGDFEVVLLGDGTAIEAELAMCDAYPEDRLHVVHTPEVIAPGEPAVTSVRRKPRSSIVMGIGMQQKGQAQAFVSAGSTGAVMAASLFLLRPLPGVDRPAIGTPLPTAAQPVLLLDAGANVDCKPDHLLQFARLGAVYVADVWRRPRPRVGLLNIGEEPEKGDERTVAAHRLLASSDLNFVGNVEGHDVVRGTCDVLVADGFVGNVLLKFYESVTGFMHRLLRQELAEQDARMDLDRLFHVFDYTEYGGAPLLGVNGVSIICHGSSPPRAIANAIRVAVQAVDTRLVGHIRHEVESHPGDVTVSHGASSGDPFDVDGSAGEAP
jgi:glycerol-3-phosphate acyltransferase PlsX